MNTHLEVILPLGTSPVCLAQEPLLTSEQLVQPFGQPYEVKAMPRQATPKSMLFRSMIEQKPSPVAFIEGEALSMSSQEVADLVGSRHDKVKQSIERLADRGAIRLPPMGELKNAGGQTVRQYVFQGEQGKRDSIIVVAQLSPEFTAALVDRWQELEDQVAKRTHKVPTSFVEAMKLATELEEQRIVLEHRVKDQAVKIEQDAPKVEVFTKLVEAKGLIGFQEFCTALNLHQRKVKKWMLDIGWLRVNRWRINPLPTAKTVDHDYCVVKITVTDSRANQKIMFTTKALAYVELNAPDYIRKNLK